MNYGEELAYWYQRLNGFFPLSNFVVHRSASIQYTSDVDALAVRPPHVYEEVGGRPEDWDADLARRLGLGPLNSCVVTQVVPRERMRYVAATLIAISCLTAPALGNASSSQGVVTPLLATASHSKATPGVARHSRGHIARNAQAKAEFRKAHPCPSTGRPTGACPGYVIDHVTPLKRGGADAPYNMQWQTTLQAKEKDRWE